MMLEIISQKISGETIKTINKLFTSLNTNNEDIGSILSLPLENLTGIQLSAIASRLFFILPSNNGSESGERKSERLADQIIDEGYLLFPCKKKMISDFLQFTISDGTFPDQNEIEFNLLESDISGGEVALLTIFGLASIKIKESDETIQELLINISREDWRLIYG